MNKLFFSILFSFSFLFSSDSDKDALDKLNQIRFDAGLNKLTYNKDLWKSSKNHTIYLVKLDDGIKHVQSIKTEYYTGTNPWDRALHVGYNNKDVSENISYGIDTYEKSIDLLMTAIYHRFGFLNFNINEIGFFKYDKIATYNMGNSVIRQICSNSSSPKEINIPICDKKDFISRDEYISSLKKVELNNPDYVIFPSEDSHDNLPAFYDETPNPVPDKLVTGNPISIQFNESTVSSVELKSFKLFEGSKEISSRLLFQKNDPNKRFSAHQFALFPLERLKWGRTYTAEFKAIVNGESIFKRWTFYTKRLDGEIFSIKYPSSFSYERNTDFFLTFDPERFGRISMFRTNCSDIEFIDYNTLKINLSSPCFIELNNFDQFNLSILK